MAETKPFDIPKRAVWEAYKQVKANRGAAGVDEQSLADFEADLSDNLYRLWNRMSSGSYLPAPVRRVEIPKGQGATRPLGIPTVADRVAQTVVTRHLTPILEPVFDPDSYGYRPGRSAHDAVETARRRCWRYDWVVDLDIEGFFDNLDWTLTMKALRRHTDCKWILLYVERWLQAPESRADGSVVCREKGTPQGGVVSPLLANLFLHYTFDCWMRRTFADIPFERYADDIICHCRSETEAHALYEALERRFRDCKLQLHPEKTKIAYCKDANRRASYPVRQFDFLGFCFRPRKAMNRQGRLFTSFSPAVGAKAAKAMRARVRSWKLHHRGDLGLEDLVQWTRPVLRGWVRYYGRFYPSALQRSLRTLDAFLVRWAQRKYKRLKGHKSRAWDWLARLKVRQPDLFPHWTLG